MLADIWCRSSFLMRWYNELPKAELQSSSSCEKPLTRKARISLKEKRGFPSIFRRFKESFPYHQMFSRTQVIGMRKDSKA